MTKKTKSTLTLVAVLAILIIIMLVWQNPWKNSQNKELIEEISITNLDQANKIEITNTVQNLVLEKQDQTWQVIGEETELANQELVNNLITTLDKIDTGTIVSTNQDKLVNFYLEDELATKLKISDNQGNIIFEILVGKPGASMNQSYIKKPDSNNILLINQNLLMAVAQPDWTQPVTTDAPTDDNPAVIIDDYNVAPIE